ncbi:jg1625 [Pararge aegeria aegeria]|uniref:Jg1625 protein n=1 Tax=Pararge aegeria aegeria TaxID=348720 RepID=A0A8S4RCF0_9NEOP|nr:jg1625 [Pararge aegeria aegeria]
MPLAPAMLLDGRNQHGGYSRGGETNSLKDFNASVAPLVLQMFMGGGDHLTSVDPDPRSRGILTESSFSEGHLPITTSGVAAASPRECGECESSSGGEPQGSAKLEERGDVDLRVHPSRTSARFDVKRN